MVERLLEELRSCEDSLSFKSKGDGPDNWMCPMTRADGSKVYECALIYTDDCLVISDNAEDVPKKKNGRYF